MLSRIRRILVPVDFSARARAAADYAALLAERFAASLDVLHVCSPDPRLRAEVNRRMEALLAHLERYQLPALRARLEVGDPQRVIHQVAEAGEYDLLVMGTYEPLGSSSYGGVAVKVVLRAPCPILTTQVPRPQAAEL